MEKLVYSAVLHREDDLYVAECPETGTVSQGTTMDEALENLKEATELYIEEFGYQGNCRPFFTTFEAAINA